MSQPTRTADSPVTHLSRVTAAACVVLGLVLLWRLPLTVHVAPYLGLVVAGVALGALVAAARLLTGHGDGRALALTVVALALVGQALNTFAGLPAATDLRGQVGWAMLTALAAEVVILSLLARAAFLRAPRPRARR
ncbi:hypothetical protein [Nocardioides iriomotensis]|uniref:Uncharacterized protein n=1 Tax=Nocardioides iriomotensis TaxID=715784 RepID=A0A4Q5IYV8_9ACTN|nr:hypothetical protein [Nocardioides iriomotensis]RYU10165.1 hypothetical protein ETU37_17285 [Nocardioides iriomotensis]